MANPNQQNFVFRRLSLAVRSPRVVMLLRDDDSDWQGTVLRIIQWFSSCWGGCYALIVPTDGRTIDEEFWWVMAKYDPDYFYRYRKTLLDLKVSRPNEYDDFLKRNIDSFVKSHPDSTYEVVKESIEKQVIRMYWGSTDISDDLRTEIKRRLNPFHRSSRLIHDAQAGIKPTYPLTYLPTAIKGTGRFRTIFAPKIEATKEFQLLAYSITGKVNDMLIKDAMQVGDEDMQEGFSISFQEWPVKNLSTRLTDA